MSPFANVGNAVVTKLAQVYGPDLKVLGAAILVLVGGIVGVWFLLRLFGGRIGLSETAKQRIRDKAAKRKAAFPFKFSYAGNAGKAKAADASGPWTDPAEGIMNHSDNAAAAFGVFTALSPVDGSSFSISSRDASEVEYLFDSYFGHIGRIQGLSVSRSVSDVDKASIFRHAARLAYLKASALAEQQGSQLSKFTA